MFRVLGYSLGSDGSCLYRTSGNDFWLYPLSDGSGWFVHWGTNAMFKRVGPDARKRCLRFIEQAAVLQTATIPA